MYLLDAWPAASMANCTPLFSVNFRSIVCRSTWADSRICSLAGSLAPAWRAMCRSTPSTCLRAMPKLVRAGRSGAVAERRQRPVDGGGFAGAVVLQKAEEGGGDGLGPVVRGVGTQPVSNERQKQVEVALLGEIGVGRAAGGFDDEILLTPVGQPL